MGGDSFRIKIGELRDNDDGKKEIIEILADYRKEGADRYGILEIGVFGSATRDEIGGKSDEDGRITGIDVDNATHKNNLKEIIMNLMPAQLQSITA